jgi:SAM-dependent methyltransferase
MGLTVCTESEDPLSARESERFRIERAIALLSEASDALPVAEERALVDEPPAPFAAAAAKGLNGRERRQLEREAAELGPWFQGPFHLAPDQAVGGAWRSDLRWNVLEEHLPPDLTGMRVLDVGSNAGYDPFMFAHRGAEEVIGCEPGSPHEQALFLESIYRTGADLRRIGWQDLDPGDQGRFELIHCNGVLYHEPNPMMMLERLRPMLADGGTMIFGTMLLASSEQSEYARFVPGAFADDRTWWWVPGRLAFRWMCEAVGFSVGDEFGAFEGPRDTFPVISAYTKLTLGQPAPELSGETR